MFSACRSNVIMINGSVWEARFGAVICGIISFCLFSFLSVIRHDHILSVFWEDAVNYGVYGGVSRRSTSRFNATLVCRAASLSLLLPSASVSCDVQRGAGDIITLCLFLGPCCDCTWGRCRLQDDFGYSSSVVQEMYEKRLLLLYHL